MSEEFLKFVKEYEGVLPKKEKIDKVKSSKAEDFLEFVKNYEKITTPKFLEKTDYDSLFEEIGKINNVDPKILKSIAKVESSYNPKAVSNKGAEGLMQIMPQTKRLLEQKYNIKIDPFDPRSSINASAVLMNELITKYKNKGSSDPLGDALEDYNGGPSLVGKSRQTADYRKKVLSLIPQTTQHQPKVKITKDKIIQPSVFKAENFLEFAKQYKNPELPVKEIRDIKVVANPTSIIALNNSYQRAIIPPKNKFYFNKSIINNKFDTEENYLIAENYLKARYGLENLDFKNMTRQEVIDQYLSSMRSVEWNTTFGGAPELLFISNIEDKNTMTAIAQGHQLYDTLPDFFDDMQGNRYGAAFEKFVKGLGNVLIDPSNLIGLGIGSFVKFKLARVGIKKLLQEKIKESQLKAGLTTKVRNNLSKEKVKELKDEIRAGIKRKKVIGVGAAATVEGVVGSAHSIIDQEIDLQLNEQQTLIALKYKLAKKEINQEEYNNFLNDFYKENKLDKGLVALNAGLAGILGGAGTLGQLYSLKAPIIGSKEMYEKLLKDYATTPAALMPREADKLKDTFLSYIKEEFRGEEGIDWGSLDFEKIKEFRNLSPEQRHKKFIELKSKGKITLEKLQESGVLTESQIQNDIFKRAYDAAYYILLTDNEFKKDIQGLLVPKDKNKKQIGQVLETILTATEEGKIDNLVLENALKKAGLDVEDFTRALGATTGEAGSRLNKLSQLMKGLKRTTTLDPDMQRLFDTTMGNEIFHKTYVSPFVRGLNAIKRLEREAKALVVSSIATTIRNVYGSTIGLTLDSATKVLDTAIYHSIKNINAFTLGKYEAPALVNKFNPKFKSEFIEKQNKAKEDFLKNRINKKQYDETLEKNKKEFDEILEFKSGNPDNISQLIESNFGTLFQLFINTKSGFNIRSPFSSPLTASAIKTADQFDLMLSNDPNTRKLLLTSLQETGEQQLSKLSMYANTLNIAQDAIMRRAAFVNSVKRQLTRVGLDYREVLANNVRIPPNIIKKATDEALETTFGKMPVYDSSKGITDLENIGSYAAKTFIDFFEKVLPFGSLLVPFPRFMANAMAFQYKYSIFQFGKAGSKAFQIASIKRTEKKNILEAIEFNEELLKKYKGNTSDVRFRGQAKYMDEERKLIPTNANKDQLLYNLDIEINKNLQEVSLALSRGMVGTSLMIAATQYREDNQDIEPGFVKTATGGIVDIRNIFPIYPFLALGDYIAKSRLGTADEASVRELSEALAGIKLSPAPIFPVFENLTRVVLNPETAKPELIERAIGEGLGDFGARFIQTGQPVFNFMDLWKSEYGIGRDPNLTESDPSGNFMGRKTFEIALNRIANRTSPTFTDGVTDLINNIPGITQEARDKGQKLIPFYIKDKDELAEAVDVFRAKAPVRGTEFFSTLVGFRVLPRYVNDVEKEFKRLNMNIFKMFPSSGNREYDKRVIEIARKYIVGADEVPGFVTKLVNDETYLNSSRTKQKLNLLKETRLSIKLAKQEVLQEYLGSGQENIVDEKWFNSLPSIERKFYSKLYKEKTGEDVRKTRKFTDLYLRIYNNSLLLDVEERDEELLEQIEGFNTPIIY